MARMAHSAFKRYLLERRLSPWMTVPKPPPGYDYLPWSEELRECHAEVLFRSFQGEIDAEVFPRLADWSGCRELLVDLSQSVDFVPQATWLAVRYSADGLQLCGTIQGIRGARLVGHIQNVGTLAGDRGKGIGTGLLLRAMHGFAQQGLRWTMLEVTSANNSALRLYRQLGFRYVRTIYKIRDSEAELPSRLLL